MAHKECFEFISHVQKLFPGYFYGKDVIEVGSLNINGSVRQFFTDCRYVGVDIGEGPGVDLVINPNGIPVADRTAHTVISTEMFEHNPYWQNTFSDMFRILKPGGMLVFTCATEGRPEHGTKKHIPDASPLTINHDDPAFDEYYRNLTGEDFMKSFPDLMSGFSPFTFLTNFESADLYFLGFKRWDTESTW